MHETAIDPPAPGYRLVGGVSEHEPRRAPVRAAGAILGLLGGVSAAPPQDAGPSAPPASETCELSEDDALWIGASLEAWQFAARQLLGMDAPPTPIAIFFDASCVRSTDALHLDGRAPRWERFSHDGTVPLPTGDSMPAVVTSFAAPLEGEAGSFFVMSTPTVWRAGGVRSEIPLDTFMTAVLLHEISHTSQVATYMRRVSELEEAGGFGPELSDDVLQDTFADDAEIADAVLRETDLLFRAAAAPDDAEARRLARAAHDSIATRRERYRDRPALLELEDVFLTLEGAAQWVALSWLASEGGGGVDADVALSEFGRRTNYWSQVQGLALFLVIDRFVPDWEREVYGEGGVTALGLFERALG